MANPTVGLDVRELVSGEALNRLRRIPGLLGFSLTAAMLLAVFISGTLAVRNKSYEPVVIEASVPQAKVRPVDRGGRRAAFQEFTLNDIIAGYDAPREVLVTGYAPQPNSLSGDDLSPRARREQIRRWHGADFVATSAAVSEIGRLTSAEAIWRSFVSSRGDHARQVSPSAVVQGADVVQLGYFRDETAALVTWAELQRSHPSLFAGVDWYLEKARNGGEGIVRLRITGFGAREIAMWFCDRLINLGKTCIPTVNR